MFSINRLLNDLPLWTVPTSFKRVLNLAKNTMKFLIKDKRQILLIFITMFSGEVKLPVVLQRKLLLKSGFLGNFNFQKSQKSGIFGLRILSPTVYIPIRFQVLKWPL